MDSASRRTVPAEATPSSADWDAVDRGGIAMMLEGMREQAGSMLKMAAMFVATIALALLIQPFHDNPASRAFGDAGASQLRYVIIELFAIFIFTAVIIWLALKGKAWIIKWGVLFILWMALSYTLAPLSVLLVDHRPDTFDLTMEGEGPAILFPIGGEGEALTWDPATNTMARASNLGEHSASSGGQAGYDTAWNTTLEPTTLIGTSMRVVEGHDRLTGCIGDRYQQLNATTGAVEIDREIECNVGFFMQDNQWNIRGSRILIRASAFSNLTHNGEWRMPENFAARELLYGRVLSDSMLLLATERHVGLYEIPSSSEIPPVVGAPSLEPVWEAFPASQDRWTAFAYGRSPFDDTDWRDQAADEGEYLLVLGSLDGRLDSFIIPADGDGEVSEEAGISLNKAIDGPVRGLLLADCCTGGLNDLYVVDGDELRMYTKNSRDQLVEVALDTVPGENRTQLVLRHVDNPTWDEEGLSDGVLVVANEDGWRVGTQELPALRPLWSNFITGPVYPFSLIAFSLSVILMLLLILHPEWYVVNLVGILVGAGVITILGISLVPSMIMIFMVLAAIYDFWAVYKSKHMLTLADTMIGLKLPILLVAPQEKGYSFRNEGDDRFRTKGAEAEAAATEGAPSGPFTETSVPDAALETGPDDGAEATAASESEVTDAAADAEAGDAETDDSETTEVATTSAAELPVPPPPKKTKSSRDAMFMGLGDVIFPGMLVLSAVTWLPSTELWGLTLALWVGIGSLIGGLVGYFVLMGYVAMGRPQAGLPLLNGGSILGFLLVFILAAMFVDDGWQALRDALFDFSF